MRFWAFRFLGPHCWKIIASLFLLLATHFAHAINDKAATEQVAAQLIASVEKVQPGSEIYLGVHQRIIPHWHTYWINPGDSGLATTIDWKLPEGATASDILWPTPGRISLGTITNYGYSDQVTLLTKIKVPQNIQAGSQFTAQATVDWLVCNEECIPQQVELSLSLPVANTNEQSGSGNPLIQQALTQLPVASPWPIGIARIEKGFELTIGLSQEQAQHVNDIWFYPSDWGVIVQNINQPYEINSKGISLKVTSGEAPLKAGAALKGVLVITEKTENGLVASGFQVEQIPDSAANNNIQNKTSDISFVSALLLALLGGLILNLMPCVFPVLSLKALSLVRHAEHEPAEVRLQGWVYTAGVLVSFGLLAGILVALKAGGAQIGWGFQFQSPLFVLAVAYLMFAVGLNLSSVFVIGGSITGVGSSLADRKGYSGSFFTGVLATVVATPCTAPFMAAALGYALSQPAVKLFTIFFSLGFGLALPYLLLANWPRLQSKLPRPGAWMEYTKQAFAFPMYATAAWLVWVLAQQAGANAVIIALSGIVILGFAAWLYNTTRNSSPRIETIGTTVTLAAILLVLFTSYTGIEKYTDSNNTQSNTTTNVERNWEPYSAVRLETLLAEGKPVFLNFTASWCISCLVNERVALSNSTVVDTFKQQSVTYLKGDWTKRDAEITEILTKFGRSGVPLYVFYPAGNNAKPVELPQLLTPDIVLSHISQKSAQ